MIYLVERSRSLWRLMLLPLVLWLLTACGSDENGEQGEPAPDSLVSIQIQPQTAPAGEAYYALPGGLKRQLKAIGIYQDGGTADITHNVTWTTGHPESVAIDESGLMATHLPGISDIGAYWGDVASNTTQVEVTEASLVGIALTPENLRMHKGEIHAYAASGTYDDGTTHDLMHTVQWQSSAPQIVSIDQTGMAVAVDAGLAEIIAIQAGVSSNEGRIEVVQADLVAIDIQASQEEMVEGERRQLTAIGTYHDGTLLDMTDMVIWRSSDNTVVTVEDTGMATALKEGGSQITASMAAIGSAPFALQVRAAILVNLSITPLSATLAVGESRQFLATGSFEDGRVADLSDTVEWRSSDPAIAVVEAGGLATGIASGSAQIEASQEGVASLPATVTVSEVVGEPGPIQIEPFKKQLGIWQITPEEFAFWNRTSINSPEGQSAIKGLGQTVYAQFRDEFDFITVIMNNADVPPGMPTGEYAHVSNDITGLGLALFDHTAQFGSAGKLQGVYFLYKSKYLSTSTYGPILHEMAHRWANWVVPTSYPGHWGRELRIHGQLNDVSANFADIELYLMGLMGAHEMTDPASINAYNLIPDEQKTRVPNVASSSKQFRNLLLVLTDRPLTAGEIQDYNDGATLLTRTDNPSQQGTNFHKMTGGRGSLLVSDLDQIAK